MGRRRLKGTTYYLNVYAFINQLEALVPLKSEEVVRANLAACLREAAPRWYITELSDEERHDAASFLNSAMALASSRFSSGQSRRNGLCRGRPGLLYSCVMRLMSASTSISRSLWGLSSLEKYLRSWNPRRTQRRS